MRAYRLSFILPVFVFLFLSLPVLSAGSIWLDTGRHADYDTTVYILANTSNTSITSLPVSVNISGSTRTVMLYREDGLLVGGFKPFRLGSGLANASIVENGSLVNVSYYFTVDRRLSLSSIIAFYMSLLFLIGVSLFAYYLYGRRDLFFDILIFSFVVSIVAYAVGFASSMSGLGFFSSLSIIFMLIGVAGVSVSIVLLLVFLFIMPLLLLVEFVNRIISRNRRGKK